MAKITKLFEPIKIGSLELPNRIVMTAATTGYHSEETDRLTDFYAARVRGGAALIIIGNIMVIQPGARRDFPAVTSDSDIPRLRRWTTAIHNSGGKVAAMLAAYGYWAKGGIGTPAEEVSPSGVVLRGEGVKEDHYENLPSRPLTVEEIHALEEHFGDSAARVAQAGFDAIEIQAVAGNLLNRFLSTATNKRTDEYGGSAENRARFMTEIIACVKKRVGQDFPLLCRISGDDLLPQGLTIDGYKEIAPLLEIAGVHAINIMPGWHISRQPADQMCVPPGAFVHLAAGIKQVVHIPVIANKQIHDPLLAEQILVEGKADIIGLCRPLIADPDLPNKAKEGRLDDIRLCVHCDECFEASRAPGALACSVNAMVGNEGRYRITKAEKPKKVFVIGGGPAGMEAARVAALRGHRVTLFERNDRLGGQLLYATLPPHKQGLDRLTRYLISQMSKLRVDVRLGEEATAGAVAAAKPDAVIVAAGAEPSIPGISGVEGKNVACAMEVLDGRKEAGQHVAVVGGGAVGCETAEFLRQRGKQVTIIEMLGRIAADIGERNRWVVIDRLAAAAVRMEAGTKVEEITGKGVRARRDDGTPVFFEADSVVIACGMKPRKTLAAQLRGRVGALYEVGDCVEAHKVRQSIRTGFEAGLEV